MIVVKEDLNIEHGFICIGGCENHDKGKNTTALVLVWVFRSSKLMGSICCTRIPFILIVINQSHCLGGGMDQLLDPQGISNMDT